MPTHHRGRPREVRALDAFIKLTRAAETVNQQLARALAPEGLTPGQFSVLEALLHLGPLCQGELGQKVLRSNPNMTAVIDHLVRDGLVTRERGTEDRRRINIRLTPRGEALITRVFADHAERITALLSPLSAAEQKTLGALCKKLGKNTSN